MSKSDKTKGYIFIKSEAFIKAKLLFVLALLLVVAGLLYFSLRMHHPIRNVLLISIDTCRADRLSCYGFNRKTTPNIDAIAANGILFEHVVSPVPLTLPAHSSMLTGTYPPYHKVRDNTNYSLDKSNVTLPEILKQHGFTTGAVISAFVLYPQFGLDQGFDSYNSEFIDPILAGTNRDTERRGGEASRFACDYLQGHKDIPFFLFLHYYDPHADYDPPEPFASQYSDDLYSGEIAYTDHCIKQVVDKLKSLGLYDSTLIIITGDHGESLGEHGETEHGYYVYQSTIDVPLIIRPPGLKKPKRVQDITNLVDIVPTILSYLKIDIPAHVQGRDLSIYEKGDAEPDTKRQVYTECLVPTKYGCNPLLGLVGRKYKCIKTTRTELYDLIQDHLEGTNLVEKETARVRLMEKQLDELVAALLASSKTISGRIELDEESRRRLESLGYVSSSIASDSLEINPVRKDPKDLIEYHESAQRVTYLKYKGMRAQAEAMCYEMLEKWPEIPNTYFMLTEENSSQGKMTEVIRSGTKYLAMMEKKVNLNAEAVGMYDIGVVAVAHNLVGQAAYELEKFDLAIEHWTKALQIRDNWPEVHYNIGGAFYKLGEINKVIEHWEKALQFKPDWTEARENLDKLLLQKKRDETIAQYLEKVRQNPDDVNIHNELAEHFYQQGEIKKAIEHWTQVVRIKPDMPEAHNSLATAYYRQDKLKQAIEHWTKASELRPDWAEAYNNLAWVLAAGKDAKLRNPDKAIQLAQRACELTSYKRAGMLDTLGVAYAAAGRFPDAVKAAQKAIELATAANQQEVVEDIRRRLELYSHNKPYCD